MSMFFESKNEGRVPKLDALLEPLTTRRFVGTIDN